MSLNVFSFLELTNFPVTNYEAELFKESRWFRENASKSHFYMICSRPKVSFRNVKNDELNSRTNMEMFEIFSGNQLKDSFLLNPEKIPEIKALEEDAQFFFLRHGPAFALSKIADPKKNSDIYCNWTVQKLLWERSRNKPWILGLEIFRHFLSYNLLYVGIAPSTNTLSRLIEGAHHARQKILSKEYPIEYGTRVTDEVHILMFEINPLFMQQLQTDEDILSSLFIDGYENSPIIKDAEKAFINLLQPKYNTEKYSKYPLGKDGIYDSSFDGYSYSVAENITLNTPSGPFMGARSNSGFPMSDNADSIWITGDEVKIINFRP